MRIGRFYISPDGFLAFLSYIIGTFIALEHLFYSETHLPVISQVLIWVFISLGFIAFIIFIVKKKREEKKEEIIISERFVEYAQMCSNFISKECNGSIYTVQTPFNFPDGPSRDRDKTREMELFELYAKTTAKKLSEYKDINKTVAVIENYYRLIIVDKDNIEGEKMKVEKFIKILLNEVKIQKNHDGNIYIGIIHKNMIPEHFYSNIEILTTNSPNHIIAYQECKINGEKNIYKWKAGYKVAPIKLGNITLQSSLKNIIETSFLTIWEKSKIIDLTLNCLTDDFKAKTKCIEIILDEMSKISLSA